MTILSTILDWFIGWCFLSIIVGGIWGAAGYRWTRKRERAARIEQRQPWFSSHPDTAYLLRKGR